MKISIGVSNRHVHLKKEDLIVLFGDNYNLEVDKKMSQPGQFASTSFVDLKTDKNIIKHVRVVGPLREYTQVEISKTDSFVLGLNPPVRDSGDLLGSSPITLIGPKGELNLKEGCIIADRHIHITPKQMELYNLVGKENVNVKLFGEKGGIITNVHLKVQDEAFFEMHLDTDDANAHLVKQGDIGEII